MDALSIAVTLMLSAFVLAILFQIYVWRESKADKIIIEEHWQKFLKADSKNDIKSIKKYASKLVWNRHLETEQLNKVMDAVNSRVEKHPEFKKLSNIIFNKNRKGDIHHHGSN